MKRMDFRSKWVIVTGASSGLGREMAITLANDHGANLVLVARRKPLLEELAQQLHASAHVEVEPIAADLSSLDDVDRVFREATAGRSVYGAVLNAGITHFGEHAELSWDRFEKMLATNVTGVVRLTSQLAPYLEKQSTGGGILLVSSMAGITPVPYQTAYSATKAFLVNFGCGLRHELADRNVSVTTFIPGGIDTEMVAGERFKKISGGWLMPADKCARDAIDAFERREYLRVPGFVYRVGATLTRLLPQEFMTSQVARTYRKALQAAAKNEPR